MNFFKQKFDKIKKNTLHYFNPDQHPNDIEKYVMNLLQKAEIDLFIKIVSQNSEINLGVLDHNKASLLMRANDITNSRNQYRKKFTAEQLEKKALKAMSFLISKGLNINHQDKNGITALLSAAHWHNYEIAQMLLKNDANPNLCSCTNNFYTNPLLSAMCKKNYKMVILLLQYGADAKIAIQLNKKGNGFKITEQQINILKSMSNIAKLIRKRIIQRNKNLQNVLTKLSDIQFEQLCYQI